MQVILLERVEKLGAPGTLVEVKRGYARNWLLPHGKALLATEENRAMVKVEQKSILARDDAKKAEAETVKLAINNKRVFLIRAAGESGQLYGSVRAADIAEAIEKQIRVLVSKKFIVMDEPIRILGISELKIRLHPQVDIAIEVNIAPSEEEAQAQAIKHDRAIAKQEEAGKIKAIEQGEGENKKPKDSKGGKKRIKDAKIDTKLDTKLDVNNLDTKNLDTKNEAGKELEKNKTAELKTKTVDTEAIADAETEVATADAADTEATDIEATADAETETTENETATTVAATTESTKLA